jgi:hypothetical protein
MTTDEGLEQLRGWFAGRLPDDWFDGAPEVVVDREEISVIGRLAPPDLPGDASAAERSEAISDHVQRFRERTRERRVDVARDAEHRFGRKVSWGVECGGYTAMFTTLSVPVMTRLRQSERRVLDTLVDAGVARSRSEALAWCVSLVGEHAESWLGELRDAMGSVDELRRRGPTV